MIAKYQDQNGDWKPITDDMTIEELEQRFDSETAKQLGVENNNAFTEQIQDQDSSIFLTQNNIDNDKTLLKINSEKDLKKVEESKIQFEQTSTPNSRPSSSHAEFSEDFETLARIKMKMNRNVF